MNGPKHGHPRTVQEVLSKYALDEIDRRLIDLKARFPAITNAQMGEVVGLKQAMVSRRCQRPAFVAAMHELLLPAKEFLENKVGEVARKYLELMDCDDPNIREKVGRTILMALKILPNPGVQALEPGNFEPLVVNMPLTKNTIVITQSDSKGQPILPSES